MKNMSNCTKASFFFYDITDPTVTAKKDQCLTLQRFDYECSRNRNAEGMPYGPTLASVLRFTLKSLPDGYLKEFYRRLGDHDVSCFTIVFDAVFRDNGQADNVLSDYRSALVVTGQIVDIDETYQTYDSDRLRKGDAAGDPHHDLMMTTVEFLLQSITYVGNNNYQKKLPINY